MAIGRYSLVILNDGTVKGCGYNYEGELGIGNNYSPALTFSASISLSNIKQIAIGQKHTLFLLNNGTVKACGTNLYGELGNAIYSNQSTATLISGLTNVKQVAAGYDFSIALLNDGTVMSWGYNDCGQLGTSINIETENPNPIPALINGLTNVIQISTGYSHVLALLKDGTVKAFGYNVYGQLGNITNLGTVNSNPTPTLINGLSGVNSISMSSCYSSFFVMNDKTVKACGYNGNGFLGIGNNLNQTSPVSISGLSNVKQIVCSESYVHALLSDGTTKAWGNNEYGGLGIGNTTSYNSPISTGLTNVKQIASSGDSTLILYNDGSVKGFGSNSSGQIGNGNQIQQLSPVASNCSNVLNLSDDLSLISSSGYLYDVWSCGYNKSNSVRKIVNGILQSSISVNGSNTPIGVCVNKDNAVWIANYMGSTIQKIVNGVAQTPISVNVYPLNICCDKDNNIWVASNNKVQKIVNNIVTTTINIPQVYGICCDKNNIIWAAAKGVTKIVNGAIEKTINLGTALNSGYGICCDLNNNIWVTEYNANKVMKIVNDVITTTISSVGPNPRQICVDQNNNLWFPNYGTGSTNSTVQKISNDVLEVQ